MFNDSLIVHIALMVGLSTLACSKGRDVRTQDGAASDKAGDLVADRPADSPDNAITEGGTADTPAGTDTDPAGLIETGQPCLEGGVCKSGYCVDSVCCAAACADKCLACAEAHTGTANGTCAPVKAGMDPRDNCTVGLPESCGDDGACDGLGACRKYGSNQICAAAACAGVTFNPARTCNSSGACAPVPGVDCQTYPCTTVGCAKPCATDTECGAQSYCAAGQCKARKSNGEACATMTECTSAFCVDGTCCQTACTGACLSCAEADTGQKGGTCQPVAAGKDPADDCPTDPAAMCGRDGTCDGKGICRKYDAATKCTDAVCVGTMFTPARICANGLCAAAAPVDCRQAMCTTAGCQAGCVTDGECAAGAYCAAGSCATRKSNGGTCSVGNECSSRACVDGVCCETTCTGLCYACVTGKTGQASGKCAPVSAGSDIDNECAATARTTCGTEGTCDGAGACRRWATGTECAAGVCNAAGNFVSARTCDGLGTCRAATTDTCAPNICAATGCERTCTVNTDCIGNTYCAANGMCTAKRNQGAACGAAAECLLGFCVDGVCCNNACSGVCVSCLAQHNGQQSNGTCADVTVGMDPSSECTAGATTCGLDGWCGGGRCRFAPATISCAAAMCSNATLTVARNCDGNGACPSTNSASPCPGNVICASANACKPAVCTVDGDCIGGYYCDGGTCRAKGAVGAACSGTTGGNQCLSNNCSSDRVCCSTACTASCQGCTNANTGVATGTCAPRPSTTQCNGACGVGYRSCPASSSCVTTSWNFDQGSPADGNMPYGWFSDDDGEFGTPIPIPYAFSSHTPGSDHGSLGVNLAVSQTPATRIVSARVCGSGLDLRGKTATAWVLRSSLASEPTTCSFLMNWLEVDQFFVGTTEIGAAANVWVRLSGTIPSTAAAAAVTKISLSCGMPTDWSGTLYFDDVSISP